MIRVKSQPPHIRAEGSVPQMMWTVVLALLPALLVTFVFSGLDAFRIVTVAASSAVLAEIGIRQAFKRRAGLHDGSAVVTGILFALMVPHQFPSWAVALGSGLAIVLGKEIFGGLGQNPFNPALVGIAFANLFVPPLDSPEPLLYGFAIFFGGVILFMKRLIYWEVPLIYLGSLTSFSLMLGAEGGETWFLGSALLAAFFLVTDPVTTPLTRQGARWFAFGAGLLTQVIRQGASSFEGVTYGILIMNALNPWLDRWLRPARSHAPLKAG